jgi:tetratricopeptide (TPR) repeat protein
VLHRHAIITVMSDLPTSTLDAALSEVAVSVAAVNEEQAITRCNELIASYPDAVRVYRARAEAHERAGDTARAIDDYTRVLEIMPADYRAMIGLARCQLVADQAHEASVNARQALDYDPLNADAARMAKDNAGGEAAVEAEATQEAAQGQVAVARAKFAAGMTNRALADLRRLTAASTDRTDLQAILAELLWRSGMKITTAELCQSILDAQPDCLNAHVILYAIWSRIGNNDLADVHARAVERLDPDYRETHAWLGEQSPFAVRDVPARVEPPAAPDLDEGEQEQANEANNDQDRSAWVDELIAAAAPVSAFTGLDANVAQNAADAEVEVEPEYAGEVAGTTPLEWAPAEPGDGAEEDVPEWLTNLRAQSAAPRKADGQRISADSPELQPRDGPPLAPLEWAPSVGDEESELSASPAQEAAAQEADHAADAVSPQVVNEPAPAEPAQAPSPIKVFAVEPETEATAAPVRAAPETAPEAALAPDADDEESTPAPAPEEPAAHSHVTHKKKGHKAKGHKGKSGSDDTLTLAREAAESAQYDEAAEYYGGLISSGKKLNIILADLQRLTQAHPEARRFHALLGDVYTRKGDVNAALIAYHRAWSGSE